MSNNQFLKEHTMDEDTNLDGQQEPGAEGAAGAGEGEQAGEGAEGAAPKKEEERALTPREIAMNAIRVSRTEDGSDLEDQPAPTPPAATPAQAPAAASAEEEQLAAQLDTPKVLDGGLDKVMVKVKVDGVEKEVSVADMQRQYQINGAAERRLQEANRLLDEARKAKSPPVGSDEQSTSAESSVTSKPAPTKVSAKDIVQALFEGDESKAEAAIAQLLEGRSEPTQPSTSELVEKLTPEVRQRIVNESALDKFLDANADITADPHLVDLTARYMDAEVAGGKPYPEALEAAGQKTRDWLAKMGVKAKTEPPSTTSRDKKLERKAAMDNVTAVHTKAGSTEEPERTASQTIAEMQKARGLYQG
jgi:hypothetical protein